jgi:hypothetical protein
MKNLPMYLTLGLFIGVGFWGSFNFNIPVDNQMVLFLFTSVIFVLLIILMISDIKEYIRKK